MQPRADDVGIAICTRDRPGLLARCLAAIAAGDVLPDQTVIVDQGSDDAVAAVLTPFADTLRILHVRQGPLGLSVAQNTAVRSATSSVVAITDDDCLPDARWLDILATSFRTAPELDLVTGRVLPAPPDGERVHPVSTRSGTRRREFRGRQVPWHVGSGNNFAVRRDAYLRVGGCDERLGPGTAGIGGNDMDLFYRLLRAGAKARYEPAALVLHERQSDRDRAQRRGVYGHGMGASLALWLRQGDPYALYAAARWVALRLGRIARPPGISRRAAAREELAILRATVHGVRFGLRAGDRPSTGTEAPAARLPTR